VKFTSRILEGLTLLRGLVDHERELVTDRMQVTLYLWRCQPLDPMIAGPEGGPSSDMQRYEG
jgi:hypothetical protein